MCFRRFLHRVLIVTFVVGYAASSKNTRHAEIGVNVRGQFASHRRLARSEDSQSSQAIELVDPEQDSLQNSAFEHLLSMKNSDRELSLVKPQIVEDSGIHPKSGNGDRRAKLQAGEVEELATEQADTLTSRLRPELSQDMEQYRKTGDDRVFMSSDTSPHSFRSKRTFIEPRGQESRTGADQVDNDNGGSLDNAMRMEPQLSLSTEVQPAEEQLNRKTADRFQDSTHAAAFAASDAAERIVSQSRSAERLVSIEAATNAAASAAVTATRVAESLPGNLPDEVRNAALQAAATAAAKATLASQGSVLEDDSTNRASLQTKPVSKTQESTKRETPGNIPHIEQKTKDAQSDLQQHNTSRQIQKPKLSYSHQRDVHQAASSNIVGGNVRLAEAADNAEAPDQDKLLYIGVFSQTEDFEKRTNVRRAWVSKLREQYGDSGNVLVEFIIGHQPHNAKGEGTDRDVMLERERDEHADLFHIPYEESPVQVLMFFAHAVEMRYRFALKIDIDRELLYQPLIRSLQREHLGKLLYAGQNLHDASLLDAADQKIQKYFAGPCYLASWLLAQRISKAHLDHSIMLWSYNTDGADVDDMDMGKWVSWEDRMLSQMAEDRRNHLEKIGEDVDVVRQRVDYRIMDICRPLPPPEIRFND